MDSVSAYFTHQPLPHLLAFHDRLAQVDEDPQVLANRVAQHCFLRDFGPRPGTEKRFLHRTSSCQAGELLLSGGYSSPLTGKTGGWDGVGQIEFILDGEILYGHEGHEILVNQQRPLSFSPGDEYTYKIERSVNGFIFHVNMQSGLQTAAAIAGMGSRNGALPDRLTISVLFPPALAHCSTAEGADPHLQASRQSRAGEVGASTAPAD
jgi:hypothetical protein